MVQSHNGIIQVTSNEGKGTTFQLYLPTASLEHALEPTREVSFVSPSQKVDASLRGRVLVVEDEDMLRELVKSTLNSLGYEVVAARNGADALNLYRAIGNKIDLTISDMLMPNMGGVDLFKEIRTIDPGAKFILVTGYSIADQDRDILSKMNAVLAKPYTFENISESIRAVLQA